MTRSIFGILFLSFFVVGGVSAHGGALSPLVVNGEDALANEIADDAQPKNIELAKSVAPRPYVIGEEVTFTFNAELLPDYSEDKQYEWELEENIFAGQRVQHKFSNPGTRIVHLREKAKTESYTTRIESLEVAVVPVKWYGLPKAVLSVNGKPALDTLFDYIEIKPGTVVQFDAGSSTGKIASYIWDFGDGKTGEGQTVSHTYRRGTFFPVYAVLRVTDESGITADTATMIDTPISSSNPLSLLLDAIRQFIGNLFTKKNNV